MLKDGDLQNPFWQWIDRFYYQFYLSWRETRKPKMEKQKQQAEAFLPAAGDTLTLEQLSWLSNLNPLRLRTHLLENIVRLERQLFFWIEPFGYSDAWIIDHKRFMITFSESEELIRDFKEFAHFTAIRAKALSDPTRLTILRFIRFFGMTNTEIASLLGISRPTVSIHVKILREAGLIESTTQGREVHHSINPEKMSELFNDLQIFLDLKNIEQENHND
jgi:DNA-binding transcriptional ArsR family regulator